MEIRPAPKYFGEVNYCSVRYKRHTTVTASMAAIQKCTARHSSCSRSLRRFWALEHSEPQTPKTGERGCRARFALVERRLETTRRDDDFARQWRARRTMEPSAGGVLA